MIQELRDFFVVHNQLLFIHPEFIGFAPTFLLDFQLPPIVFGQTIQQQHSTQFRQDSYEVHTTVFGAFGLLRGYKKIEVFKNAAPLFSYERGGSYFINYQKGSRVAFNTVNAYVLTNSGALQYKEKNNIYLNLPIDRHFLLLFENIVFPQKLEVAYYQDESNQEASVPYQEPPYRRQWQAVVQHEHLSIQIVGSSVLYYRRYFDNRTGRIQYQSPNGAETLKQIEITANQHFYIKQGP